MQNGDSLSRQHYCRKGSGNNNYHKLNKSQEYNASVKNKNKSPPFLPSPASPTTPPHPPNFRIYSQQCKLCEGIISIQMYLIPQGLYEDNCVHLWALYFGREVHVLEMGIKREIRLGSYPKNGKQLKSLSLFRLEKKKLMETETTSKYNLEKVLSCPPCSQNTKQEIADLVYPSECKD